MRRILGTICAYLAVATAAFCATSPIGLASVPAPILAAPHQTSFGNSLSNAPFDPFPLNLPAALHRGEDAATGGVGGLKDAPAGLDGPRESLLKVAAKYAGEGYIPYVWGGDAVGSKASCNECRACIGVRNHLKMTKQQHASCQACKQCGMDCSHFVQRMFREAGLSFPYLPTAKLKHLTPAKLRQSSLVDIGHDLKLAKPGDLLLHKHHVVLLLEKIGQRTGDFIHVSRSVKHGKVGGVEVVYNADLERYRGKVLKILRHVAIEAADKVQAARPQLKLTSPPLPLKPYELLPPRIVRAE